MFDRNRKSGNTARLRPEVDGLESRQLLTINRFDVSVSPRVVLPINPRNQPHPPPAGSLVPVTIAGLLTSTEPAARVQVSFQVFDELGRRQPSGLLNVRNVNAPAPGSRLFFSRKIGLDIHRDRNDPSGRQYAIVVTAQDVTSIRSETIVVTVPRNPFPSVRRPGIFNTH